MLLLLFYKKKYILIGPIYFACLKSQKQYFFLIEKRTSLLRRLQAQTHPQAPPRGKIQPFSKMAVTFEPLMGFDALQDL